MTVSGTIVEQQFTNIVVNVPLVVNIQTSGVPAEVVLDYGTYRTTASQGPDYTVVIAPDLMTFTVTPLTALMNKIAADGLNVIYVRRELPLTTDFDYDDAFVREKLVDEFNRVWMVEQQNLFRIGSLQDANDAADAAALSADLAAASAAAAAASATASQNSATASQNSAGNSAASATQSANSASAASGSATAAAGSATAASGSASAASGSAGAANASAVNAAASASAASTSATNAGNSATAAAGSATTASTQAGIATTQAGNAGTSATNAANSATAASGSATNAATSAAQAAASVSAIVVPPRGKLTLTSGVPFLTSDVLAATSIIWTLLNGNSYPWYNGSIWTQRSLAGELVLALNAAAHPINKNFDLFLFNDAGTDRLVAGPAWTNDTTRAQAISILLGYYVNTASMTATYGASSVTVPASQGLYVGTVRTSAAGQTQMKFGGVGNIGSEALFYLWNRFNQQSLVTLIYDSNAAGHSYIPTTVRQWGGASGHIKASFVRGLNESPVRADLSGLSGFPGPGAGSTITYIGLDSVTVFVPGGTFGYLYNWGVIGQARSVAVYEAYIPIGFHYLAALEAGDGTTANIFYMDTADGSFIVKYLG